MTKSDKIILQIVCKALDRNYKIDKRQLKDISWVEVMDIVTTQGVLGIALMRLSSLMQHAVQIWRT